MTNDSQSSAAKEIWDQGDAYEQFMGRWSRLVAREFLDWLQIAPGSRWLDVGCGTGELSRAILQAADPAHVTGIDPSADFAAHARQFADDRIHFAAGDARQLPIGNGRYDAVVSGLVLNFIPDLSDSMRDMMRVLRPGGTLAAYVWDYAEGMQMLRLFWDAAVALNAHAADRDEGTRFAMCERGPLVARFGSAGLRGVDVRAITIPTRFRNFEDYWTPFLSGQGPAPGYVRALNEESRSRLRDELRSRLPESPDGSIALVARAWAVRGTCAVAAT